MSQYIRWPAVSSGGISTYANFASLPSSASDGTVAVTLDTDTLYIFNLGTNTWLPVGGPSVPLSIGTIDSETPSNNGAVLASGTLVLQSASDTKPGLINTTSQSIAGEKSFTDRTNFLTDQIEIRDDLVPNFWTVPIESVMVNSDNFSLDRVGSGIGYGSSDVSTDVQSVHAALQSGSNAVDSSTANTGDVYIATGDLTPSNGVASGLTGNIFIKTGQNQDTAGDVGGITLKTGGGYTAPVSNQINFITETLTFATTGSGDFNCTATNINLTGIDSIELAGTVNSAGVINANAGIDRSTAGTLGFGTVNASTINIGNAGATVNIQGTTLYENVSQLQVTDPLITLNKGGGAGSAASSGIELEENSSITGYVQTSSNRNSWQLKAPNTAGVATITPGAGGITLDQSSHNPLTLTSVGSSPNANGASLSTQQLQLQPADGSNPGVVSTTTQTFAGNKTFSGTVACASNGLTVGTNQLVVSGGFLGLQQASPTVALHLGNTGNLARGGIVLPAQSTINFGSTPGSNSDYAVYALYGDTGLTAMGVPTGGTLSFRVANSQKASMDTNGNWTAKTYTATDTTNQLVLGTTRTITLNAPTPATSSRTILIPDPGSNDTFALVSLQQNIINKLLIANSVSFNDNTANSKQLSFDISGSSLSTTTTLATSSSTSRTITLPNATTTLLGTNNTATVTNKTIDTADNTIKSTGASSGQVLTADGSNNTSWTTLTSSLTSPTGALNYSISVSVAANALTIDLKNAAGSNPSAGDPVSIAFRNATAATGDYVVRTVTSALSLTVPSGTTIGSISATDEYAYIYALDNSGTVELVITLTRIDEASVQTTSAISGGSSRTTLYSTSARTSKAVRLLGRIKFNESTAGTWASAPSEVSLTLSNRNKQQRSRIGLRAGNGYGSGNTFIMRFSNVDINLGGNDMTLVQSGTDGDSVTINVEGNYFIKARGYTAQGAGATGPGISRNASAGQMDASVLSITDLNVCLGGAYTDHRTANEETVAEVSWSGPLYPGDIVRYHAAATASSGSNSFNAFYICRLSD